MVRGEQLLLGVFLHSYCLKYACLKDNKDMLQNLLQYFDAYRVHLFANLRNWCSVHPHHVLTSV